MKVSPGETEVVRNFREALLGLFGNPGLLSLQRLLLELLLALNFPKLKSQKSKQSGLIQSKSTS
eukprot:m.199654 g.199654  ORF g.199654 m.199654 type:complete len:64 (-) comp53805_c0_seq1:301-492(-)